ncbi:uncharacterized protein LOC118401160 isoform X3 [Oncorhynchus keta]|uniref:uncharacterized protein LOC118401160 isoform X3 n=1 Tax=Oncorhynchus keta TaxID=8018 RepID=UPI0015FAB61C|nr:uncharacterized protein LOC118401160 isoform X3 [Oncorhynchus keta]
MEQGVMEQCVAGLYQSLGRSLGGQLSPQEVCVLFHKVFHLHTSLEDAHTAIKKVAGDDESWSSSDGKVLEVLLEMERERERRDEIYWDLQLLNTGKLRDLYHTDTHTTDTHTRDTHTIHLNQDLYHTTSQAQYDIDTQNIPTEKEKGKERKEGGVCGWRLRRAVRQRWARLVQEGVCGALPSLSGGRGSGVRSQALGCVSLSELLLLVGVKYDAVTHILFTEMLQEHHGLVAWKALLPWEREEREAELGLLWEETQESDDMLSLSDLPGAFRIYRCSEGVSLRGCPDWVKPREQSWSAISLLTEIHTSLEHETNTLTALAKRLDRETLQLMGLYASLATIRAQRETLSRGALLAARQDWETWPRIIGSCKRDQAQLWLQEKEEEEEEEEESSVFQQQVVLRCLVLNQEWERKCLLRLLHGDSPDKLQGPGEQKSPIEAEWVQQREEALRVGCMSRLRHTHTFLLTQAQTHAQLQSCLQPQTLPEQGPAQPQSQTQSSLQHQSQWGGCALVLLVELMDLQEAQVSAVLSTLLDRGEQCLLSLIEEYESELREPRLSCLLTLLTSNPCLASDPNTLLTVVDPCLGPSDSISVQNISSASPPTDLTRGDPEHQHTGDLCTGCGTALAPEDLPYLEILCVSDTIHSLDTHHTPSASNGFSAEREVCEGREAREGSHRKTPQSYEKQGSLITLAWSKPPDGDTEQQTGTVMSTATEQQEEVGEVSVHCDTHNTPGYTPYDAPGHIHYNDTTRDTDQVKVLDSSLFQYSSEVEQLLPPTDQHPITGQKELVMEQSEKTETLSNVPTHTPITHTEEPPTWGRAQQEAEKRCGSPPVNEEYTDDLTALGANGSAYPPSLGGEREDMTELWALSRPAPLTSAQETLNTPHITLEGDRSMEGEKTMGSVMERERTLEPVSMMEREKTMRSLVDLQRKVEQKQQRDRERQLLRVQERLSIIQNKKSQEDLMGLRQTDRLRHLTHNLPQADKSQQKTVVRERLEQLRRERSYVMQSKRDRNTAGFKELLGPVRLHSAETDDTADSLRLATSAS